MKLRSILKVIAAIVLTLGLRDPAAAEEASAAADSPFREGYWIPSPALPELSGLAASRRDPLLMWALSDSGNPAELVSIRAGSLATHAVSVEGTINHDWEDLASFEMDGQSWLLIADTGDNLWLRSEVSLILVPEPDAEAVSVRPARTLRVRYEDGPRDCEAMAVDPVGRRVLLADKTREPVGLYEVSLDAPPGVQVARRIASFPPLVPAPRPRVQSLNSRQSRGLPTGMDLSADGRRLVVLTYRSATLFERLPEQDWAQALARPRVSVMLPPVTLAESIALDGPATSAWIGTETRPAGLFRWALPPPPSP